jgi:hypothetical protein
MSKASACLRAKGVEGKIQADGNDMMIGESPLKIEF